MRKRKSPCYKCESRIPGCHGKCEAHKEYKQWYATDLGERMAHMEVTGYEVAREEKKRKSWERWK